MWKSIVLKSSLDAKLTLLGGQSFRWREHEEGSFIGVFANILWLLKVKDSVLNYQILGKHLL
jgi:hypothetical protein